MDVRECCKALEELFVSPPNLNILLESGKSYQRGGKTPQTRYLCTWRPYTFRIIGKVIYRAGPELVCSPPQWSTVVSGGVDIPSRRGSEAAGTEVAEVWRFSPTSRFCRREIYALASGIQGCSDKFL